MMQVERIASQRGGFITTQQKVCFNWRAGKCNRYHCPYLHTEIPDNRSMAVSNQDGFRQNRNSWIRREQPKKCSGNGVVLKKPEKVCRYWLKQSCSFGEKCKFLHSWYKSDDSFTLLSELEGHDTAVTGIALPSGSDKLYTGSKDGSVRVWDCNSGQCAGVIDLGVEIGCVVSEGPWIFVGMKNFVRAWNSQTNTDITLDGPSGQVYAIVEGNNMLFAGVEDGSILVWKFDDGTNNFVPLTSLKGHNRGVVTLVVGANRLYSGSIDHSIRMWNLENLECMQTLTDHEDVVMSVLCWDQFLLSCSLDKTVKVWGCTEESGNLQVIYTHNEEHGLLKLLGMEDAENKPVLLCSCNNNSISIYDLPSFVERGKIFSKIETRSMQQGPSGIFFTGDGAGPVRVWKWEERKC